MSEKDKKQELPSFFQMAKNFAADLSKYVAQGAPNVTQPNYIRRLAACEACPHLIKDRMRCGKCGCLVEHKAKWKTTTCPDKPSRWPQEILVKDYDEKRKRPVKTSDKVPNANKQGKGDS